MNNLGFIVLMPLIGALINGFWGKQLPKKVVTTIACLLPTISFLIVLNCFFKLLDGAIPISQQLFNWATVSGYSFGVDLYFDQLTAVMCLIITGVGTLIHIYSVGYMAKDPAYSRYFSYLNLFLFFMLLLVLGKNMLILFLGWEGVGLCSYLLIGFWYEDADKAIAGKKAFITNRVGDAGFLIGMFLIFFYTRSLDFVTINQFFESNTVISAATISTIGLLLFVGACGKSAQIPLFVWLPDAMAGPTPVSALIHAATMVTAGVYLMARLNGLYIKAEFAMQVIGLVGAFTAFFAATIALVQKDIKLNATPSGVPE